MGVRVTEYVSRVCVRTALHLSPAPPRVISNHFFICSILPTPPYWDWTHDDDNQRQPPVRDLDYTSLMRQLLTNICQVGKATLITEKVL